MLKGLILSFSSGGQSQKTLPWLSISKSEHFHNLKLSLCPGLLMCFIKKKKKKSALQGWFLLLLDSSRMHWTSCEPHCPCLSWGIHQKSRSLNKFDLLGLFTSPTCEFTAINLLSHRLAVNPADGGESAWSTWLFKSLIVGGHSWLRGRALEHFWRRHIALCFSSPTAGWRDRGRERKKRERGAIMERSKAIERKTDKCRDREMQYLDVEEGSKRARATEMALEKKQMPEDRKRKTRVRHRDRE